MKLMKNVRYVFLLSQDNSNTIQRFGTAWKTKSENIKKRMIIKMVDNLSFFSSFLFLLCVPLFPLRSHILKPSLGVTLDGMWKGRKLVFWTRVLTDFKSWKWPILSFHAKRGMLLPFFSSSSVKWKSMQINDNNDANHLYLMLS